MIGRLTKILKACEFCCGRAEPCALRQGHNESSRRFCHPERLARRVSRYASILFALAWLFHENRGLGEGATTLHLSRNIPGDPSPKALKVTEFQTLRPPENLRRTNPRAQSSPSASVAVQSVSQQTPSPRAAPRNHRRTS